MLTASLLQVMTMPYVEHRMRQLMLSKSPIDLIYCTPDADWNVEHHCIEEARQRLRAVLDARRRVWRADRYEPGHTSQLMKNEFPELETLYLPNADALGEENSLRCPKLSTLAIFTDFWRLSLTTWETMARFKMLSTLALILNDEDLAGQPHTSVSAIDSRPRPSFDNLSSFIVHGSAAAALTVFQTVHAPPECKKTVVCTVKTTTAAAALVTSNVYQALTLLDSTAASLTILFDAEFTMPRYSLQNEEHKKRLLFDSEPWNNTQV